MASRLGLPLAPVLPVHLCPLPGSLYSVLMGYKESPVEEARRISAQQVFRLFTGFFRIHQRCLAEATGDGVDLVLPVPSTARPGRTPLERVEGLAELCLSSVPPGATWVPRMLQRSGGDIGHMRPNRLAFAVPDAWHSAVRGARVLLLDDTYVSGARAQSAAAAFRRVGAHTVLIVPLGRVIRPERFAAHAAFMKGRPTLAGHVSRCLVAGSVESQTDVGGHTGAGKP